MRLKGKACRLLIAKVDDPPIDESKTNGHLTENGDNNNKEKYVS